METNLILKLTFDFSLKVMGYTELLEQNRRYNMANQLFRSATSIGANVREAQSAESKKDFIHKMKVADKEAHETQYWLMLCEANNNYPKERTLTKDLNVIMKVLGKIIISSKA